MLLLHTGALCPARPLVPLRHPPVPMLLSLRHRDGAQVHPPFWTLPTPGGPVGAARLACSGLDGLSGQSGRRPTRVRSALRLPLNAGMDLGRWLAAVGEEEGSGEGQNQRTQCGSVAVLGRGFCGGKLGVYIVDEPSVVVGFGDAQSAGICSEDDNSITAMTMTCYSYPTYFMTGGRFSIVLSDCVKCEKVTSLSECTHIMTQHFSIDTIF